MSFNQNRSAANNNNSAIPIILKRLDKLSNQFEKFQESVDELKRRVSFVETNPVGIQKFTRKMLTEFITNELPNLIEDASKNIYWLNDMRQTLSTVKTIEGYPHFEDYMSFSEANKEIIERAKTYLKGIRTKKKQVSEHDSFYINEIKFMDINDEEIHYQKLTITSIRKKFLDLLWGLWNASKLTKGIDLTNRGIVSLLTDKELSYTDVLNLYCVGIYEIFKSDLAGDPMIFHNHMNYNKYLILDFVTLEDILNEMRTRHNCKSKNMVKKQRESSGAPKRQKVTIHTSSDTNSSSSGLTIPREIGEESESDSD